MTTPTTTNVAQGDAHVDVQAGVVHGDINFYRLPPNPSPEEQFTFALKYLDARVRDQARQLIEKAVAGGYATTEVQFYRLIALLSGRTLRQLASEELDRLTAICASLPHLDDNDEWTAGLKVITHLLAPVGAAETDLVVKEIDALNRRQRDGIYGHLEALLEGAMQEEMWRKSVVLADSQRTAEDRFNRVWKFFHPTPAQPRTLPVQPVAVALRDWLRAGAGVAVFTLAVVQMIVLVTARGTLDPFLGLFAALVGLAAFCVGGADRYYRGTRLRAKEAQIRPPQQRRRETPPGGFARKVDRLFDRYFRRYVPEGTDRAYWLEQTAGIRRHLRDEVVELYREQRIEAERVAWLVRHLVGDVRGQWERDSLTAYRQQLRTPARTTALDVGGLALLTAGSLWAVPAVVTSAPLSGTGWFLLAVASAVPAVRSSFRIVAERRRVADDQAERNDKDTARWAAYHRWCHKLSDKPSDTEMATWLESDRKVLVDQAMQQYRLRPSQVIAHAFIEAPAPSCKKARYPQGPWRYSRYRLLLFLLTDDGVRQVNIDLDFETSASRTTQRLNYRFDAVAAVRIDGIATRQQTFELTLFNGEPISIRVSDPDNGTLQHDENPTKIAELSLDAAGLSHTLHVLEGIAAEGKEWVKHRRDRADERLANLASAIRGVLD
ncbi:hypothetical protein [Micromonospora endolithica]|uniref:Uncharacterized protein n=1 Tax=Micromonospora endolithica TaxID=230091 RepID=A0A3A9ZUR2_9ACTN|nr:hypothetical protein [Micromonospora endolithica]RKN51276.1 hypothetical protein D7223_01835 [Micromonospora endolithica]TWJ20746.1 hypothetical protein JD76_00845 [Micromonospora endolithica]